MVGEIEYIVSHSAHFFHFDRNAKLFFPADLNFGEEDRGSNRTQNVIKSFELVLFKFLAHPEFRFLMKEPCKR